MRRCAYLAAWSGGFVFCCAVHGRDKWDEAILSMELWRKSVQISIHVLVIFSTLVQTETCGEVQKKRKKRHLFRSNLDCEGTLTLLLTVTC